MDSQAHGSLRQPREPAGVPSSQLGHWASREGRNHPHTNRVKTGQTADATMTGYFFRRTIRGHRMCERRTTALSHD
jgi:hypothetical protein